MPRGAAHSLRARDSVERVHFARRALGVHGDAAGHAGAPWMRRATPFNRRARGHPGRAPLDPGSACDARPRSAAVSETPAAECCCTGRASSSRPADDRSATALVHWGGCDTIRVSLAASRSICAQAGRGGALRVSNERLAKWLACKGCCRHARIQGLASRSCSAPSRSPRASGDRMRSDALSVRCAIGAGTAAASGSPLSRSAAPLHARCAP